MHVARDEIHCWSVRLDIAPATCAALSATLSDDERTRSARLRSPQLQRRFIAAHGGLRQLLAHYLRVEPSDLSFSHNEFGKPALNGGLAGQLTFNLSHSADLALIGIAAGAEIGVDLEHLRDEPEFAEIARWYFTANEVEELNGVPSEHYARTFLSCWTRKEAYAKARGEGIGAVKATVPLPGWSVYSLQPAPGYVGALVVEGSNWRVTQRYA